MAHHVSLAHHLTTSQALDESVRIPSFTLIELFLRARFLRCPRTTAPQEKAQAQAYHQRR